VGGTAWMYISPVTFERLGFADLDTQPVAAWSEAAMRATPFVVVGAFALLGGVHWLRRRRLELASTEPSVSAQEEE